jgi:hypothetical protein
VTIHEGSAVTGKVLASGSGVVSGGSWSYTVAAALKEGTYTVQASQSDEAGNVGESTPVTFAVDVTPPVVTLTAPVSGVHLNGSRPTFGGRAGVAPGDEPTVTLKIYTGAVVSGSPLQSVSIKSESGKWSTYATGPALANGEYTAVAEQSDDAGNIGKSQAVTFTVASAVTLDTSRFVQRETEPGSFFTGPTPTFDGTAGIATGDGKAVLVKVYRGLYPTEAPVATLEGGVSGSGTWAVGPLAALESGVYTVQAEQEGSSDYVAEAVFTVDAQAPQLTLTAPASGSASTSSSVTAEGAAGTAEGDLPTITAHLYAGPTNAGSVLQTLTTTAAGGSWSAAFSGLSPGTYTVQAEQSDDVGNTGHSEAVTFTVNAPPPTGSSTPAPPAASFKWLPSTPSTGETVTLVSTATDSSSPITGFAWALAGNSVFAPGEPSLTTSFATPGSHVVQLQVTDANGASSTVAESIPVVSPPVSLMQPFPVVRMAGSFNASGAKITVLSVLAPLGATVTITCRGPHCPVKSQAFLARAGSNAKAGTDLITIRRFERSLKAGVVLGIWVSKDGEIGKFTRFTIRRNKSPLRVDLCLNPAGTTPIVCPS